MSAALTRDGASLASASRGDRSVGVDETGRLVFGEDVAPTLAAGMVLNGRYTIEHLLGYGGMGVVYRAADALRDGQPVALKMIRSRLIRPERLSLFKAEFKVAAGLRHPNVASVYDFEALHGSDENFFTMELVEGRDALAATERASVERVVELLVGVCRALSYIHDHGVIHCDLKPANIVVGDDGAAKVLDFGLAGARARAEVHGLVGTPAYIAPELIRGSEFDHRTDLYSLGITAYQLLCRSVPFQGEHIRAIYHRHCTEALAFHEEDRARLPEWLRAIILRLCEKEASNRYRSAGAVIDAINRGGAFAYEHVTTQHQESYILSSRFTGRRAELERLVDVALGRTSGRSDHAPAWFVCGQSGIGKSRLMRELKHTLQLGAVSFVEGSCYEVDSNAFGGVAEILRHLVTLAGAVGGEKLIVRSAPELVKIVPSLGHDLDVEASAPLPSARDEQLRLCEHVSELVLELSAATPLVLYVNDLQWAQPGAVSLLLYLLRRIHASEEQGGRVRVTLFATYRDDEVQGRALEELLAEREPLGASETIRIEPLGRDDVAELVRSMLGVDVMPPAFVDRVCSETGGNPFFVQEVMRALVENGAVYLEGGSWAALDDMEKLDIPEGVAAVFLRRVGGLDETARAVLEALAAFSAPAGAALIARAAGLDPEAVHDALVVLERRQMVAPHDRGGEHRITHDRMRETVYAALRGDRRTALHARIAAALGDGDGHAHEGGVLAHHYARAGDLDAAVEHGTRAARRAADQRQLTRALALYEQVAEWLASLGPTPARDQQARAVLIEIGRIAEFLGETERHAAAVDALLTLAARSGAVRDRLAALCAQGGYLTATRRFEEARSALEEALRLSGEGATGRTDDDVRQELDILRSLAFCAWQAGEMALAAEYNERALALDDALGDRRGRAVDLGHLASCLRGRDDERALRLVEEAVRIEIELGDTRLFAQTMAVRAAIHAARGDLAAKEQAWALAQSWDEAPARAVFHNVIILAGRASTLFQLGDLERSLAAYEQLVSEAREVHFVAELARSLRMSGELHAALGDVGSAAARFAECAAVHARTGDLTGERDAWRRVAEVQPTSTRALFAWRKVRELARRRGDRDQELSALEALGRASARTAPADAERFYEEALEIASALDMPDEEAALLNSLAIVAWEDRRYEVALGRYREAMTLLAPDDRVHRAFLLNSVGATLRSLGRVDEARESFDRALAEAEACGERLVAGHALAALADIASAESAEQALAYYRRSLAIREAIGDARGEGWMTYKIARMLVGRDDAAAIEHLSRARERADEISDAPLMRCCMELAEDLGLSSETDERTKERRSDA